MRIQQVPQLLDGLFKLQESGIPPPTPLIVAMDGAGKNGILETYTRERGLQLVVTKLSTCESPGDLIGVLAVEDHLPCPACFTANPEIIDRFPEAEWLRHGREEHQMDEAAMRAAVEPLRAHIRKASHSLPPAWLPSHGRGIWVLDEFTRANSMMENATLELVRERRLSMARWALSKNWLLVALANPNTEGFTGTNPLDAASESRVVILSLEPTVAEFLDYARRKGMHPSVVRLVERNPQCLDGLKFKNPMLENVRPNPRRLDMLSDLARVLPDDLLLECALGLLGTNYADGYTEILREKDAPLLADEVLAGYAKQSKRLKAWVEAGRMDLVNSSLDNVLHHLRGLDGAPAKKALGNVNRFLLDLPAECMMKFGQVAAQEAHKGGIGKTYAALRDGFPAFGSRFMEIMGKGVDLAVPVAA
jgi:hypothetical protein